MTHSAPKVPYEHVAINEPVSYEIKFRAPQHHEPAYLLTYKYFQSPALSRAEDAGRYSVVRPWWKAGMR